MPGNIVATYLVKVTLREREDAPDDVDPQAPTNAQVEEAIAAVLDAGTGLVAKASAERTDR